MKQFRLLLTIAFLATSLLLTGLAQAQGEAAKKAEKAEKAKGNATYLITCSHTPETCLAALDAMSAAGKDALAQCEWGCKDGDHTAYMMVQADSKDAALAKLPEDARKDAKATMLVKFTQEDIKKFHESMGK